MQPQRGTQVPVHMPKKDMPHYMQVLTVLIFDLEFLKKVQSFKALFAKIVLPVAWEVVKD
jgi:hypothetical protein